MKTKKKGLHQKFPRFEIDLRSHAHQSQIMGGDANDDHNQIIGGDTVKLLAEIYRGVFRGGPLAQWPPPLGR